MGFAQDQTLCITDRTFLVYRRYYFVARLERTIELLAKFAQKTHLDHTKQVAMPLLVDDIVTSPELKSCTNQEIQSSIAAMQTTKSLKPLFMVWDNFASYKSLKDDLFVEDFSKEIFIVTRALAHRLQIHTALKSIPGDMSLLSRCDAIEKITESIENYGYYSQDDWYNRGFDMSDLRLTIHTDEVAHRYYMLRRLQEAVTIITQLPIGHQHELHAMAVNMIRLHDKQTRATLRTFAKLWDDCRQYKFIDNDAFLHTFAVQLHMMLHAYQDEITPAKKKMTYNQLMQIYQQINKLPIEEILNSIDFLVTGIAAVSASYEKNDYNVGAWLREYWWAPPMVVATIIFQCVKFYYKKYYRR